MEPFARLKAVAAPLPVSDVDTDTIIPSREMKTVFKRGLADGLFAGWRYRRPDAREPEPQFVLNRPEFRDAQILVCGSNFGCGSSREHAVWALREYGIRAILAPSFAGIFFRNCVRNGILPAALHAADIERLTTALERAGTNKRLLVDLDAMRVTAADGTAFRFAIDARSRRMLREGLDPIAETLRYDGQIRAFLERDRRQRPWIYNLPKGGG